MVSQPKAEVRKCLFLQSCTQKVMQQQRVHKVPKSHFSPGNSSSFLQCRYKKEKCLRQMHFMTREISVSCICPQQLKSHEALFICTCRKQTWLQLNNSTSFTVNAFVADKQYCDIKPHKETELLSEICYFCIYRAYKFPY